MYPRGTGDGKGNSLSLYLNASNYVTNNGPKGRTFAVYKLRVLDQLHRNHFEIGMYVYVIILLFSKLYIFYMHISSI